MKIIVLVSLSLSLSLSLQMKIIVLVSSTAMEKEVSKNHGFLLARRSVIHATKFLSHNKYSLSLGQYASH
jgi:hypothetical protein